MCSGGQYLHSKYGARHWKSDLEYAAPGCGLESETTPSGCHLFEEIAGYQGTMLGFICPQATVGYFFGGNVAAGP